MVAQIETGGADQIADVFDENHIEPADGQFLEGGLYLGGGKVASSLGVDLDYGGLGSADCPGVDISLNITFNYPDP